MHVTHQMLFAISSVLCNWYFPQHMRSAALAHFVTVFIMAG